MTKILWVEKNRDLSLTHSNRIMTRYKTKIELAHNVASALELANENLDLVLFDIAIDKPLNDVEMPVARQIKKMIGESYLVGTSWVPSRYKGRYSDIFDGIEHAFELTELGSFVELIKKYDISLEKNPNHKPILRGAYF